MQNSLRKGELLGGALHDFLVRLAEMLVYRPVSQLALPRAIHVSTIFAAIAHFECAETGTLGIEK